MHPNGAYINGDNEFDNCPDFSGVTMDASLTSNKVKTLINEMKKSKSQKYYHRHVATNILLMSLLEQYQSHGNGSTVKQLKGVFMLVVDVTCIPILNVFMRKMVS